MTRDEKQTLQTAFFQKAGPNFDVLRALFDKMPETGFYVTDDRDRIIAFNRWNCEVNNIADEFDYVGRTCLDIYPSQYAEVYMSRDREVRRTGVAIVDRIYTHAADLSTDFRRVNVYPLRDRGGAIIGTVCVWRSVAAEGAVPAWYGKLKDVVAFIDTHYAESISLERLARLAGLSTTHLRRIFTQVLNVSPGRYITTIRLNAARKLLATTDKLVADIAVETGFWDQSHFVKAFKAERGQTPSQYRRKHTQERCPRDR